MFKLVFKKDELKFLLPFYLYIFINRAFKLISLFSVLYFLEIGLGILQISFIMSINYVAQLIFEIPTGAISDIFGRKFSVLLSFTGISICLILVPFTSNYYVI
jgi:MFS family permease